MVTNEREIEQEIPGLGHVSGVSHDNLLIFHNIPYAAAPIGALRFRPPKACGPWDGVRDGRNRGAIAPQLPSRADGVMGPISAAQDEDCLTLAIWAPNGGEGNLPVMVWIHGGGFLTGGGALDWYDGSALAARENVVVVGINYRLGALGYLAVADVVPGNLALLDQLEALRWIRRNIAAFGGDPETVTVAGESGGAHSIASLLTSPDSEGLFSRAILQSPPLGIGLANSDEAQERANVYLDALGLDSKRPDLLDALGNAPLDQLLQAQGVAAAAMGERAVLGDLRPAFLPTNEYPHPGPDIDLVVGAARAAAARGVEVMIGWTRDEAAFFLSRHPLLAEPNVRHVGECAAILWGREKAQEIIQDTDLLRARFIDAVTANSFRDASQHFAGEMLAHGGNAYVYQFDWSSPSPGLGACHCLDISFMFGTAAAFRETPLMAGADPASVSRLTATMMASWGGFVRNGDPGFACWTEADRPLMHFDDPSWVGSVDGGRSVRIAPAEASFS